MINKRSFWIILFLLSGILCFVIYDTTWNRSQWICWNKWDGSQWLQFYRILEAPLLEAQGRFFVDTTGTIDDAFLNVLHEKALQFETIGFQCAGFFTNNTDVSALEWATRFGNKNGIGDKNKDNGIAITICLKKRNKQSCVPTIGVAIGKGLEGLLNDAKVGRFLEETFVPARANGDWKKGLVVFLQKTYLYLQDPQGKEYASEIIKREPLGLKDRLWLFFLSMMLLWVVGKIRILGGGGGRRGGGGSFGGGGAGR